MKDDGGPAFPIPATPQYPAEAGMSLRDWFAGMAMQGLCATATAQYDKGPCNSAIVQRAYVLADAMLEARK